MHKYATGPDSASDGFSSDAELQPELSLFLGDLSAPCSKPALGIHIAVACENGVEHCAGRGKPGGQFGIRLAGPHLHPHLLVVCNGLNGVRS